MSKFTFQLFSDVHMEYFKTFPKFEPHADFLFLAGDIGKMSLDHFKPFFDYCSENWKHTFFVLGNHEYYGKKTYTKLNEMYKKLFNEYSNVHLLDNSTYELDDLLIVGSTLWSKCSETYGLNDFESIHEYNSDHTRKISLTIDTFNKMHEESVEYLTRTINNSTKKVVVMTHFPPLQEHTSDPMYSTQPKYMKDYFASNILKEGTIKKENVLCWLFGHTHYSIDFYEDNIRMISNQVGYHEEKITFDHTGIYMCHDLGIDSISSS